MARNTFGDLLAFRAVALERSFTRAAAQMGMSTSALSHTIRGLEERPEFITQFEGLILWFHRINCHCREERDGIVLFSCPARQGLAAAKPTL